MSRGYGGTHQAIRTALLPTAYGRPCSRCGKPMYPHQPLDLDHDDNDRSRYRGFSHASCNRAAGARKANARRKQRNQIRRERTRRMLSKDVILGVQISEARDHTSVAAASWLDEAQSVVVVALLLYLDGVATAPAAIAELGQERDVDTIVVDPHSPAATLIRPLKEAGFHITEPTTSQVVIAFGSFIDRINAGGLRPVAHPALDAAARHGTQRPLAGANTWARRGAAVDSSPLDAATLAVWGRTSRSTFNPGAFVAWR